MKTTHEEIKLAIENKINGRGFKVTDECFLDRFDFKNISLSIQASRYHYCTPRQNCEKYTHVEIGFPSFDFSKGFINQYAEDKDFPQGTVYPYVPIDELVKEIVLALKECEQND